MSTATAEKLVLNSTIKCEPPPKGPALKWAGGKRWLVPQIKALYEAHRTKRLVEPFVGGMAVTLGLNPARALLNDLSPHLVNFYNFLKQGLVIAQAMENDRSEFESARSRFNEVVRVGQANTAEAAALFYYLNRTCFNGLCRFNSRGEFNVPFGRYAKINYVRDFTDYAPLFANWNFECGDFTRLSLEADDFLYVDPPYDVEFTRYSKDDFRFEDQERLVRWLLEFKGPIVASNQATDRIIKLYSSAGFKIETLLAPRRISNNGDRTPALEMLATKNLC